MHSRLPLTAHRSPLTVDGGGSGLVARPVFKTATEAPWRLRWVRFPHAPATASAHRAAAAARRARSARRIPRRRARYRRGGHDHRPGPRVPDTIVRSRCRTRSPSAVARSAPSSARCSCPGWGQVQARPQADRRPVRRLRGVTLGMSIKATRDVSNLRAPDRLATIAAKKRQEPRTGSCCSRSTTCSPGSRRSSPRSCSTFPRTQGASARPGGSDAAVCSADPAPMNSRARSASSIRGSAGSPSPARSSSGFPASRRSISATPPACRTGPSRRKRSRRYSLEILDWLLGQGVKAVVVACNTSTAHALDALREASPVPVVGVIEPGARAAVAAAGGGTDRRDRHGGHDRQRRLRAGHPRARTRAAEVRAAACPLFVPLVEEGWFDHRRHRAGRRRVPRAAARAAGVGSLVLGCTHYPLLKPLLQRVMGPEVSADRQRAGDRGRAARRAAGRALGAGGGRPPEPSIRGERRPGQVPPGRRAVYRGAAGAAEVVPMG